MMHSRVSNQAHGARPREFRATERGHSGGEIAAAGVRALRAGVPASELLQLSVCDASGSYRPDPKGSELGYARNSRG